jgi:hypothetical protein
MAKTLKFYTQEELTELQPFAEGKLSPSAKNLAAFCEKYNRGHMGVQVQVYKMRKGKTSKRQTPSLPKAPKTEAKVNKNEFIIPITRWEIRNDEQGNNLVLHFSK